MCGVHEEAREIRRCAIYLRGEDCGACQEENLLPQDTYSTDPCPIHGDQDPHDRKSSKPVSKFVVGISD